MYRHHQPVIELLLAVILKNIELVEAGVSAGQSILWPVCLVDLELLWPGNALQNCMTPLSILQPSVGLHSRDVDMT